MAENTSQQRSSRELIMLNEPISRVIPKMAIPTIVAFLITSVYNLADTYFVSSLGTNATAAVSVNGSLDQIIMMGRFHAGNRSQQLYCPIAGVPVRRRKPIEYFPPHFFWLLPLV